jgi:hypothetical protein
MASRPVYKVLTELPFVEETMIDFKWFAGFAVSQKQKSIQAFHEAINNEGLGQATLEISSKSEIELGVALSAFNLKVELNNQKRVAVENIFQAAKIFQNSGPHKDLLYKTPLEAKRDIRLKESGDLTGFQGKEGIWPLEPKTLFYDWIYINALHQNISLADKIMAYDSFTDIEFNPSKSFNCQARSVALYVGLRSAGKLDFVLKQSESYKALIANNHIDNDTKPVQKSLI